MTPTSGRPWIPIPSIAQKIPSGISLLSGDQQNSWVGGTTKKGLGAFEYVRPRSGDII